MLLGYTTITLSQDFFCVCHAKVGNGKSSSMINLVFLEQIENLAISPPKKLGAI
jgi:hypothetical protein